MIDRISYQHDALDELYDVAVPESQDIRGKLRPDENGNLVTSKVARYDLHWPVIDVDVPCRLIPSSTEGHFHLYIDKPVAEDTYWKLLDVMVEAGIVEAGYVRASKRRGFTAVRKPGVKKNLPPVTDDEPF